MKTGRQASTAVEMRAAIKSAALPGSGTVLIALLGGGDTTVPAFDGTV